MDLSGSIPRSPPNGKRWKPERNRNTPFPINQTSNPSKPTATLPTSSKNQAPCKWSGIECTMMAYPPTDPKKKSRPHTQRPATTKLSQPSQTPIKLNSLMTSTQLPSSTQQPARPQTFPKRSKPIKRHQPTKLHSPRCNSGNSLTFFNFDYYFLILFFINNPSRFFKSFSSIFFKTRLF